MKAYRHNGASGNAGTGARVSAEPKHSTLETGSELSQRNAWMPQRHTESPTPLLDALFGAYTPAFSPTVGGTQAERYRSASDAEVDAMDPAAVRADLLAEQAQKDAEPWVQPGGPRDVLDVAKERQAMEAARHAPKGLQDGGHAWKLLNDAPKGQYREDIQEGRISSKTKNNGRRNLYGGYKYMYDAEGNETGWTNCSTFTTDQVMADAGYNIDKRMTIDGKTASLSDFANNRMKDGQSDYELRTLQGDLETPIFDNTADYHAARAKDSALTHGLAGALVHAKDDNDVPLGTYLPNKEGDAPREKTKSDLNFIRPGDALQTYDGNAGHSVIISKVVLENEHGEQRVLDGSEDEVIETLDGWTVMELSYLSANASNDQGQVLTDKTKSVEEMYADYDGLIAARPRHNDWGSIGFEEGEDGAMQEVVVDPNTLKKVMK